MMHGQKNIMFLRDKFNSNFLTHTPPVLSPPVRNIASPWAQSPVYEYYASVTDV